jgi:hypothetical protein
MESICVRVRRSHKQRVDGGVRTDMQVQENWYSNRKHLMDGHLAGKEEILCPPYTGGRRTGTRDVGNQGCVDFKDLGKRVGNLWIVTGPKQIASILCGFPGALRDMSHFGLRVHGALRRKASHGCLGSRCDILKALQKEPYRRY